MAKTPVARFFVYEHLPQGSPMREVAQDIATLAERLEASVPDGPEKSAGMRKLLEAKDCLVRAVLP